MDNSIIFLVKAMLVVFVVLGIVVGREVFSQKYVIFTRNDLKPIRGKNLQTGCTVFYFDSMLPFTINRKKYIDKLYNIGSIIVDNNDVYKIDKIIERTILEKARNAVGRIILEVTQYQRNNVNMVPMKKYNKRLYIIKNEEIYIDLSEYERDIESLETSMGLIAQGSSSGLYNLSIGYPISIKSALNLGSKISSCENKQNLLRNEFFDFWNEVCSILQNETDFTNISNVNNMNVLGDTYINGDSYIYVKDSDDA